MSQTLLKLVSYHPGLYILLIFPCFLQCGLPTVSCIDEGNVPRAAEVHYYGDHWILHVNPEVSSLAQLQPILSMHGFKVSHRLDGEKNAYAIHNSNISLLRDPNGVSAMEDLLRMHPNVVHLERETAFVRTKRGNLAAPSDPLFNTQFYLGWDQDIETYTLNIHSAWQQNATGRGVTIGVIDDGLDYLHPDLQFSYHAELSYDLNDQDPYPYPRYAADDFNAHGTKCAGIMSANADNNVCIAGIAPDVKVASIRLLDKLILTDVEEASSLLHKFNQIDIYTASWGPEDSGSSLNHLGKHTRKALERMNREGRGGKGNLVVWASGDGGAKDNCNADIYVINPNIIAVAGVLKDGSVPNFTEMCAAALVSTFGSQVATTKLYGECESSFGGTSASAPQAAGVLSLLLSVNPELTLRDVQHITVLSSQPLVSGKRKTENDPEWEITGSGLAFHEAMGFGLMDAGKMVELGREWRSLPPKRECRIDLLQEHHPNHPEFFHALKVVHLRFNVHGDMCSDANRNSQPIRSLEHVQLVTTAILRRRGDLRIFIQSPAGTLVRLMERRPYDSDVSTGYRSWPFMTVKFWAENPQGEWNVWYMLSPESNLATYGILTESVIVLHATDISPLELQSDSLKANVQKHFADIRQKFSNT